MTERLCIRGCTQAGVHYATCPDYAATSDELTCKGCAPRECRDGSLICNRCFGRMRGLLGDVTDLYGRLSALADPAKAKPLDDVRARVSMTEPPAVVSADLLDALHTLGMVAEWVYVDLATVTNDLWVVTWLGAVLLDRHPPVDGLRTAWSVQDAVDTWGVERRDAFAYPDDTEDDDEEASPVTEWYDPLLISGDAAKRAKVSQSQLRKWVQAGVIEPVARLRDGRGVVSRWYRASHIDAAAEHMKSRRHAGVALE
ncbi:MAG: hypothetical protein ACRDT9_00180 [Agromyces sp.]